MSAGTEVCLLAPGCPSRPHACLLAAQNAAACSKLSPGEMPFWTSSSFPPLPTTTWLRRIDLAALSAPNALRTCKGGGKTHHQCMGWAANGLQRSRPAH